MVTLVRTDDRCSCAASIRHLTAHPTLACLGVATLLRDDMSYCVPKAWRGSRGCTMWGSQNVRFLWGISSGTWGGAWGRTARRTAKGLHIMSFSQHSVLEIA